LKSGTPIEVKQPAHAGTSHNKENKKMNNALLKLYVMFQNLKNDEQGQDLVEYALLVCLIALACVTGVSNVTQAVTKVFSNISASLA
jgi:pilus assembly protein Flp/PilA